MKLSSLSGAFTLALSACTEATPDAQTANVWALTRTDPFALTRSDPSRETRFASPSWSCS